MTDASRPGWDPPVGTYNRIRARSIWAVAFFAASVPPAFVGAGVAVGTEDHTQVALPLALGLWAIGLCFALWAAFPTLRYWENLPNSVRWLGALPLLSVSLFLSIAIVAVLFVK
jgi:hypothetical protein